MQEIERAVDEVDVVLGQLENIEQHAPHVRRAAVLDLEPDGVAARALAQLVLDGAQQIFRFFLVDVEIAVARDAEAVDLLDLRGRGRDRGCDSGSDSG